MAEKIFFSRNFFLVDMSARINRILDAFFDMSGLLDSRAESLASGIDSRRLVESFSYKRLDYREIYFYIRFTNVNTCRAREHHEERLAVLTARAVPATDPITRELRTYAYVKRARRCLAESHTSSLLDHLLLSTATSKHEPSIKTLPVDRNSISARASVARTFQRRSFKKKR